MKRMYVNRSVYVLARRNIHIGAWKRKVMPRSLRLADGKVKVVQ